MVASRSAHEETLKAAQTELQQRREEEIHYQRLVESLEEQLAQSEAALLKTKSETQAASEKSRSVQQQLARAQEGHEQELNAARERFGILDKEYDGLKGDNATLMAELEKMHSLLAETNRLAAASTKNESAFQARIHSLEMDIETLKKSISSLRQENSAKDNQIERLQRAREQLKDDKEMLNIALDSKQQEVELVSLNLGQRRMPKLINNRVRLFYSFVASTETAVSLSTPRSISSGTRYLPRLQPVASPQASDDTRSPAALLLQT
jgi:chromosome segregation ATPase